MREVAHREGKKRLGRVEMGTSATDTLLPRWKKFNEWQRSSNLIIVHLVLRTETSAGPFLRVERVPFQPYYESNLPYHTIPSPIRYYRRIV